MWAYHLPSTMGSPNQCYLKNSNVLNSQSLTKSRDVITGWASTESFGSPQTNATNGDSSNGGSSGTSSAQIGEIFGIVIGSLVRKTLLGISKMHYNVES